MNLLIRSPPWCYRIPGIFPPSRPIILCIWGNLFMRLLTSAACTLLP